MFQSFTRLGPLCSSSLNRVFPILVLDLAELDELD